MRALDTLRQWAGTASDGMQEVLLLLSARKKKRRMILGRDSGDCGVDMREEEEEEEEAEGEVEGEGGVVDEGRRRRGKDVDVGGYVNGGRRGGVGLYGRDVGSGNKKKRLREDWRGGRRGFVYGNGGGGIGSVRRRMSFEKGDGLVGVVLGGKRRYGDFVGGSSGERKRRRSLIVGDVEKRVEVNGVNGINGIRDGGEGGLEIGRKGGDVVGMNGIVGGKMEEDEKVKELEVEKMRRDARVLNERARKAEGQSRPPWRSKLKRNHRQSSSSSRGVMNGERSIKHSLFHKDNDEDSNETSPQSLKRKNINERKHGGGRSSGYEGFMDNPLFLEKMARLGIDQEKMRRLGIDFDAMDRFEERQKEREVRRLKNERELITVRSTSTFNKERQIRIFQRPTFGGVRGTEHLDVVYWDGDDAGWEEDDPSAKEELEQGITVVDESDPLAPLTSNAVSRVRRYLAPCDENLLEKKKGTIAEIGNVPVTREDLVRLKPNAWLNDEVINFYVELLKKREMEKGKGNEGCYFQNSFFYAKLYEFDKRKRRHVYDFTRVRRWTRKVDVFGFEKMVVPINQGNMHWSLCVVNFKEKSVEHYDSLGSKNSPCGKVLMKWVVDEAKHKKKIELDESEWKLICHGSRVPQQCNSDDCGVFLCKFADYVAKGREMDFGPDHINYFRGRMASEILVKRAC